MSHITQDTYCFVTVVILYLYYFYMCYIWCVIQMCLSCQAASLQFTLSNTNTKICCFMFCCKKNYLGIGKSVKIHILCKRFMISHFVKILNIFLLTAVNTWLLFQLCPLCLRSINVFTQHTPIHIRKHNIYKQFLIGLKSNCVQIQ